MKKIRIFIIFVHSYIFLICFVFIYQPSVLLQWRQKPLHKIQQQWNWRSARHLGLTGTTALFLICRQVVVLLRYYDHIKLVIEKSVSFLSHNCIFLCKKKKKKMEDADYSKYEKSFLFIFFTMKFYQFLLYQTFKRSV